ncbi:hypothetical protein JCM10212_006259, partial [Sporobolomyces blumeae]
MPSVLDRRRQPQQQRSQPFTVSTVARRATVHPNDDADADAVDDDDDDDANAAHRTQTRTHAASPSSSSELPRLVEPEPVESQSRPVEGDPGVGGTSFSVEAGRRGNLSESATTGPDQGGLGSPQRRRRAFRKVDLGRDEEEGHDGAREDERVDPDEWARREYDGSSEEEGQGEGEGDEVAERRRRDEDDEAWVEPGPAARNVGSSHNQVRGAPSSHPHPHPHPHSHSHSHHPLSPPSLYHLPGSPIGGEGGGFTYHHSTFSPPRPRPLDALASPPPPQTSSRIRSELYHPGYEGYASTGQATYTGAFVEGYGTAGPEGRVDETGFGTDLAEGHDYCRHRGEVGEGRGRGERAGETIVARPGSYGPGTTTTTTTTTMTVNGLPMRLSPSPTPHSRGSPSPSSASATGMLPGWNDVATYPPPPPPLGFDPNDPSSGYPPRLGSLLGGPPLPSFAPPPPPPSHPSSSSSPHHGLAYPSALPRPHHQQHHPHQHHHHHQQHHHPQTGFVQDPSHFPGPSSLVVDQNGPTGRPASVVAGRQTRGGGGGGPGGSRQTWNEHGNHGHGNGNGSGNGSMADEIIETAIVIKSIPFSCPKEQLLRVMTSLSLPTPLAFNYHYDLTYSPSPSPSTTATTARFDRSSTAVVEEPRQEQFRGLAFANYRNGDEARMTVLALNGFEFMGRKLRAEFKKVLKPGEKEAIERNKALKRIKSAQHLNNRFTAGVQSPGWGPPPPPPPPLPSFGGPPGPGNGFLDPRNVPSVMMGHLGPHHHRNSQQPYGGGGGGWTRRDGSTASSPTGEYPRFDYGVELGPFLTGGEGRESPGQMTGPGASSSSSWHRGMSAAANVPSSHAPHHLTHGGGYGHPPSSTSSSSSSSHHPQRHQQQHASIVYSFPPPQFDHPPPPPHHHPSPPMSSAASMIPRSIGGGVEVGTGGGTMLSSSSSFDASATSGGGEGGAESLSGSLSTGTNTSLSSTTGTSLSLVDSGGGPGGARG